MILLSNTKDYMRTNAILTIFFEKHAGIVLSNLGEKSGFLSYTPEKNDTDNGSIFCDRLCDGNMWMCLFLFKKQVECI